MHDIRRATLFTPERHPGQVFAYREDHPDDRQVENHPFLLMLDEQPIGVVRLDRRGQDEGVVRLVAIVEARQRQGDGRVLEHLVTEAARRRGMRQLHVNSHPSAVGFYEKVGWHRQVWMQPSSPVLPSIACR